MRLLSDCIRIFQRTALNLKYSFRTKKISYIIGLTVLILIGIVSIYHEESLDYTSGSLQKINDKIELITAKIDSWNAFEEYQKAEETIEETVSNEPELTQISDTTANLTTPSSTGSSSEQTTSEVSKTVEGKDDEPYVKEKGVLLLFGRNNDLYRIQETIRSVEERFNKHYQYDWLIVSDSAHTRTFIKGLTSMTSANMRFHNVPRTSLGYPPNFDKTKMKASRKALKTVTTSFSKAQRTKHTQRFWSQEIFNIDTLNEYEYFMRIEPGSLFYCDMPFDFFRFMKQNDKTLGFGLALKSDPVGFPTLWDNVLKYIEENSSDISQDNLIDFISDDKGLSFNGCQLRSSFEVGKLSFFKSAKYQKLAAYLDALHGIYLETWDDATFHTLGVALLESRGKIQFFNHLGYNDFNTKGITHMSCPIEQSIRLKTRCTCDPLNDLTWDEGSCMKKFFEINGVEIPPAAAQIQELKHQAAEAKKKEDEQRAYEEEQLEKEKAREEEEKEELRNSAETDSQEYEVDGNGE